ncbi:MAG: 30S ribosomal protein S6 [Elusimicrobia bacterium]|nr:30S ribosomal protein S6 [Elusimicrobiota bacterium]
MEYETIFVAKPDVSDEQLGEITGEVKKILSDRKSVVLAEQNWGKKTLAYEIEKFNEGVYYYIRFSTSVSRLPNDLSLFFRHNDFILRFLTVRLGKK